MRQRLRPFRDRAMARRPGDDDSLPLSPRARRIGGWIAAALLIGGIALAFRILGGNGDGTVVDPSPSGSTASAAQSITFGTALDPATGEVAADARTERFAEGDTFVYSVAPSGDACPTRVYVEVRANGRRRGRSCPGAGRRAAVAEPGGHRVHRAGRRPPGGLRARHVPDAHLRRSGGRPARRGHRSSWSPRSSSPSAGHVGQLDRERDRRRAPSPIPIWQAGVPIRLVYAQSTVPQPHLSTLN